MSEAFKEKPLKRSVSSLEWLRQLAASEIDDEEDRAWLFALLNQAYARGSADGRRAAIYDAHAYACAMENARLHQAVGFAARQTEWESLSPEQQEKEKEKARAARKANRELRNVAQVVREGVHLLKKEKESGQ